LWLENEAKLTAAAGWHHDTTAFEGGRRRSTNRRPKKSSLPSFAGDIRQLWKYVYEQAEHHLGR
jgi:hypothetical protein